MGSPSRPRYGPSVPRHFWYTGRGVGVPGFRGGIRGIRDLLRPGLRGHALKAQGQLAVRLPDQRRARGPHHRRVRPPVRVLQEHPQLMGLPEPQRRVLAVHPGRFPGHRGRLVEERGDRRPELVDPDRPAAGRVPAHRQDPAVRRDRGARRLAQRRRQQRIEPGPRRRLPHRERSRPVRAPRHLAAGRSGARRRGVDPGGHAAEAEPVGHRRPDRGSEYEYHQQARERGREGAPAAPGPGAGPCPSPRRLGHRHRHVLREDPGQHPLSHRLAVHIGHADAAAQRPQFLRQRRTTSGVAVLATAVVALTHASPHLLPGRPVAGSGPASAAPG